MNDHIETVARAFLRILHDGMPGHQWTAILEANRTEPNPDICHSHDYCDANECMAAAIGEQDGAPDPDQPEQEEAYIDLWNAAWQRARELMRTCGRHVLSATFEHPGYVEVRLIDGRALHVGTHGIDYLADADQDGTDDSVATPEGVRVEIGDVVAITSQHMGGNLWSDYVALDSGACIVVCDDAALLFNVGDDPDDIHNTTPAASLEFPI